MARRGHAGRPGGALRGDLQPRQPAVAGQGHGRRRSSPGAGRRRRSPRRVRRGPARLPPARPRHLAGAPDPGPRPGGMAIGPAGAPARRRVGAPDGGAADARPAGGCAAVRPGRRRPASRYAAPKNPVMTRVQGQAA